MENIININSKTNPFINKTEGKLTKSELIKTILMTITFISIIRFILTMIFLILTTITLVIFTIGYHQKNNQTGELQDMSKFRRCFLYLTQFFIRCVLYTLGYWWISFSYPKNTPLFTFPSYLERSNGPKIFIANHISFIDGLVIMSRSIPCVMAQANVAKFPIIGLAISALSPILVPVTDKQKETLPSPMDELTKRIKSNAFYRPMFIFPEGTTTQTNTLVKFKDGSFINKFPVQPIVLKYKYKNFDPSWTVDVGPIWLIFRMCCQFINHVSVEYLPVVEPDENDNVESFKQKVVDAYMKNEFSFEKSCLTVRDNHFLKKMLVKYNIPISYICNTVYLDSTYGISECIKISGLNINMIEELLKKFYDIDTNKIGKISIDDLKKLFDTYIVPIEFYEYIKTIGKTDVTFYDIIELCHKNEKWF